MQSLIQSENVPLLKMIKNFEMATTEHQTQDGALLEALVTLYVPMKSAMPRAVYTVDIEHFQMNGYSE